jgi:hypothetical protein
VGLKKRQIGDWRRRESLKENFYGVIYLLMRLEIVKKRCGEREERQREKWDPVKDSGHTRNATS